MVRVKRGNVARKRRKKILSPASGYRGAHSVLFIIDKERIIQYYTNNNLLYGRSINELLHI